MRHFYILSHDPDPALQSVVDYDLAGFDDLSVFAGDVSELKDLGRVNLQVDASKRPHDYLNNPLGWCLVSTTLRGALQPWWSGEFFPMNLHGLPDGGRMDGFWLGVVSRRLDCMNLEHSDFRERDGRVVALNKLVVSADKVPDDVHVFLLERYPWTVVVDGVVKDAIAESGSKGMALIECEVV
jgi:hypothetical protein